ncbi:hypothetical protein YSA_01252 [Pseudomonas putida ND6]|uniref:Uncharacterized protein n=1 Tax=Pseudomonas putida ND6 TaxID=231023 RepID=I3UPN6_PSEPU|nr:hypothetical protein YSA_01252 [Pseudomonas putida ND6]
MGKSASCRYGTRPNGTRKVTMTDRSSHEFYEIHHINKTKVIDHGVAPH